MKRREFFWNSLLISGFLPPFLLHACKRASSDRNASKDRLTTATPFELAEVPIQQLQEGMTRGDFTSRDLVEMYFKRIEDIDRNGVQLKAVIAINPDALTLADTADLERKNGTFRGALHGIPFMLKDNIDTGDKMATTAGSLALSGHIAPMDAPLVSQLRDAGAILLGKTNLSEWANFRSTRSASGWSSLGGQTRNPYDLRRNPCGSSSGSAVAVAANLCAFAIGTETNGSIICPASVNGVVGLKPTVGLVSRRGIIPISKTQDTAGPMTRTVREAAIVLGAISAADDQDPAMVNRPATVPRDYTRLLDTEYLRGKRIGVEKSFLKVHEKVDALLQRALAQMEAQGATVVEVDHIERLKDIQDNELTLLEFEFKDGLNQYLSHLNDSVNSLRDIIAFNRSHAEAVMPYFGQEIFESSSQRGDLNDKAYKEALDKVLSISRRSIDGVLQEYHVDSFCGPSTGPAWCTDAVNGDSFSGYGMGSAAAMAGYPSITVPLGYVHGLPVGLSFMGLPFREAELLAIAYAFEQASRNRKPPIFREER